MHSDPESLKNIVSKVLTWLIRTRWRRAIWGTLSVIKCKLALNLILMNSNLPPSILSSHPNTVKPLTSGQP